MRSFPSCTAIWHLLYAFITHFLHEYGYLNHKEPFQQLLAQVKRTVDKSGASRCKCKVIAFIHCLHTSLIHCNFIIHVYIYNLYVYMRIMYMYVLCEVCKLVRQKFFSGHYTHSSRENQTTRPKFHRRIGNTVDA